MATFLGRLRRDSRGNTLAIMAAALIPLIAMIGSGIDMTRAYMAQNRFRQACDAGSLAGRRILSGTTVSDAVRTEATKYFRFNFPTGQFQSANYTLAMSIPAPGTLHIESETTIPTTLMKMFGYQTLPINASCSATQDFVNTDIMMVFDLSGSMNCPPGVGGACGEVEQSNSKIGALRSAAVSLYDTLQPAQDQLRANNLRLRYGFVNYNSSVNVGRILYNRNPDWLQQTTNYQSRTPNWVDATESGYVNGKSNCESAWQYSDSVNTLDSTFTGIYGGWWQTGNRCNVVVTTTSNPDGYTYESRPVDTRAFLSSSLLNTTATNPAPSWPVIAPAAANRSAIYSTSTWDGCIEERQTNNTAIDGGTSTTAPADAYDLNVDLPPTNAETRWRAMWPDIVYYRDGSQPVGYACPTEARRLAEYYNNKADFVTYIDGLRARGSTYHDLGMIWGARFISTTGLFASATPETNNQFDPDNPAKIRGFSVKKYMIFMTDGDMAPVPGVYSSYGVEALDGRVMGSPSNDRNALTRRHLQRFRMACNAAKAKGIDIWVIAFATTLTDDMKNCASKPDQAAGLSSNAALIAKFEEIGSKIGSLRLSQ